MRDKRMRRACKTPWVITLIVTSATATAALVSGGTTSHGQDLDDVGIYNGNPTAGREAIGAWGCVACHRIPGVAGPYSRVGPDLSGFASQQMIGGVIANEPAKLIEWLQNAPKFSPETAMPRLDIPERQARDMAAYLRTLK